MHKAVKRALIVEDDEDANDWLDARERVRALDPEAVAGSVDFAVIAATRKRQGVYVASRERHAMWWRQLRVDGIIPITSTWFDESSSEFTEAELCRRIPVEISQSTMLVVYVEPADLPMMFVEVGMALALGLRVFVAAPGVEIPALGSWIWSRNVTLCADLEDAVRQARSLIDAWENA